MGNDSLSSLINQKSRVKRDIRSTKSNISALEDKITRLSTAKTSLDTSIAQLESIKSDVDGFEISSAKWQGTTEKSFEGKYNSYGIFLKIYKSDTEEAREQIEEALEKAKEDKGNAETTLSNLEGVLSGLDTDIAYAREAE